MIATSALLDDYTDRAGANALKARIEAYWRERGFDIQVMLRGRGLHAKPARLPHGRAQRPRKRPAAASAPGRA